MSAFVQSNFERRENDDYQSIDDRLVPALFDATEDTGISLKGPFWEPCAPTGSGLTKAILTEASKRGDKNQHIYFSPDAVDPCPLGTRTLITNPPYSPPRLASDIVRRGRDLVQAGEIETAVYLLRSGWDHARSREDIFSSPVFAGLVRLRFRPWWSDQRTASPIHNYQWVIFSRGLPRPIVMYGG
jgi:hypothetical protein